MTAKELAQESGKELVLESGKELAKELAQEPRPRSPGDKVHWRCPEDTDYH